MSEAYKNSGELHPLTSSNDVSDFFSGRFTSVNIQLRNQFTCKKGSFRKKRPKKVNIDISIASIYFPVDSVEHDCMLEFVESKIAEWPNNHSIIIGQDSNAKV